MLHVLAAVSIFEPVRALRLRSDPAARRHECLDLDDPDDIATVAARAAIREIRRLRRERHKVRRAEIAKAKADAAALRSSLAKNSWEKEEVRRARRRRYAARVDGVLYPSLDAAVRALLATPRKISAERGELLARPGRSGHVEGLGLVTLVEVDRWGVPLASG